MSKYAQIVVVRRAMSRKKFQVVFTLKQALEMGFSRRVIDAGVSNGELIKIGQGIYFNVSSGASLQDIDYIAAYTKFGKDSYIGGLSSLFYYGLIDASPQQVWIVVPSDKRTIDPKYRLIRTGKIYNHGIIKKKWFKIASVERAVVDAFRFSSKIGLRTAYKAAVRAVSEEKTSVSDIIYLAEKLEYGDMIKKYVDTIVGMLEAG